MSITDRILIVVTLVTALWWLVARRRHRLALDAASAAALVAAAGTLAVDGITWQLVPWQLLAVAVSAAAWMRRRGRRSHRLQRVVGRAAIFVVLLLGGLASLTAVVPSLPEPSGPYRVGSEVLRWTDDSRPETLTATPSDSRQVVAQAWYPTDARVGRAVPYFEAQGRLPGSVAGLPAFAFGSFGRIDTHALDRVPVSESRPRWPVLLLSPGLSIPREQYTALCADLASRGFVVIALSVPYESDVTVLADSRVVGRAVDPDVTGPPPHPALERLIRIRAADARFVLDRLERLSGERPRSRLAGHLDLGGVGVVGHSLGGATAVEAMAADRRLVVGVNLDGKLFGGERDVRLGRPFLWIQSDVAQTAEYAQGRDRFMHGQTGLGRLVTLPGSRHLGFTDNPSYLSTLGRTLVGDAAGIGSLSLSRMTDATADAIAAFVGPALGTEGPPSRASGRSVQPTRGLSIPAPTGAHRVGMQSLALTDRTRREPQVDDRPRSLVIQLWHPVTGGHRQASYMPPAVARFVASSAGLPPAAVESVRLHAVTDGAPVATPGGWPVLLFSPGFGVPRQLYAGLVEEVASHGYVVVAIDHPHDASIVQFPDGRVVRPAAPMDITHALAVRVADTRSVLRELARLNRAGAFEGMLDLDRVGMAGHSLGGATAAAAMLVDTRIRVGADLDGMLFGDVRASGLSRPFMLMSADPGFAADPNRAGFWARLHGPRVAVDVTGARHFAFSDLTALGPQLARVHPSAARAIAGLVGDVDGPAVLAAQRAYLVAFLDRFLRQTDEPLLGRTTGPFAGVRLTLGDGR
jgi:predicted dienelactone hydrolase